MAKLGMTQTTPHDSPRNSSFLTPKVLAKFEWGHPQWGAKYTSGMLKYRESQKSFEGSSSAYTFKMPEPISMIFGTLQHRFILNTSIYSLFLKFIKQNGNTWLCFNSC